MKDSVNVEGIVVVYDYREVSGSRSNRNNDSGVGSIVVTDDSRCMLKWDMKFLWMVGCWKALLFLTIFKAGTELFSSLGVEIGHSVIGIDSTLHKVSIFLLPLCSCFVCEI